MQFNEFQNSGMVNVQKKKKNSKVKSTVIAIIVFLLVIALCGVIYYFLIVDKIPDANDNRIDENNRIIQVLYHKVHDFRDNTDPLWMYHDEVGSIANMAESVKMSLVYLNLNVSDFQKIQCDGEIPNLSGYSSFTCSGSAISKSAIERVYKELFGGNASISTSAVIKCDEAGSSVYIYDENRKAYVLYVTSSDSKIGTKYEFSLTNIDIVDNKIVLTESISSTTAAGSTSEKKYAYTFIKDDDQNYTYSSLDILN